MSTRGSAISVEAATLPAPGVRSLRLRNVAVAAMITLLGAAVGRALFIRFVDNWPALPDPAAYSVTIDEAVAAYTRDERDFTVYRVPYDSAGPYLGFASMSWDERPNRTFDEAGLPMMLYGTEFEYNPITVAQFALSQLAKGETGRFVQAATFLRDELMGRDGGFRFEYEYRHYLGKLQPGWTSAMAQGQALSVFARAYQLDRDPRWIDAGRLTLDYLLASNNGLRPSLRAIDPSLEDHRFFSEWPIRPADLTLNGAMFTMLGLYDWATIASGDRSALSAQRAWDDSLATLKALLPYYDMGRITAYDLTYLTYPNREPHIIAKYHGVHGYLLYALVDITGDQEMRSWLDRWDTYP